MDFSLIFNILAGGLTGYITNEVAVNMLFREYKLGPLGSWGGVIVKTRDTFIDEVSSLVERDIINYKTLSSEFETSEIEGVVESVTKDFLKYELPKLLKELSLSNLEGSEDTVQNLASYVKSNETLKNWIKPYLNNTDLDVIDIGSQEELLKSLVTQILELLQNNSELKEVFKEVILSDIDKIKVAGQNVGSTIEKNLIKMESDGRLDVLFEEISNVIASSLNSGILEKPIDLILKSEEKEMLKTLLITYVKEKINGKLGKQISLELSKKLIEYGKSSEKTLISFMKSQGRERLQAFLTQTLPKLKPGIVEWIIENEVEIENLLEDSLIEVIKEQDDVKKNMLEMFEEMLIQKLRESFKLSEKAETILSTDNIEVGADLLTQRIFIYLETTTVADLIEKLEERGFLSIEKVSSKIQKIFLKLVEMKKDMILNPIFSISLKNILGEKSLKKDKLELFVRQSFSYLTENKMISSYIDSLKNKINLRKLIDEKTFEKSLSNKEDMARIITDSVSEMLKEKKIIDIISPEDFLKLAADFIEYRKSEILNINLNSILKPYIGSNGREKETAKMIMEFLKGNLEEILQGNIKGAVASNLSKLKDEEIQDITEEFIGRELQPITIFGAFLGVITGIGLWFFQAKGMMNSNIGINMLVYAILGILTNVIALWMVFRPYEPLLTFGQKTYFQGLIGKEKSRFAKSLGRFVGENLLNRDRITSAFSQKRSMMISAISKFLEEKGYDTAKRLWNKNYNEIASSLARRIRAITKVWKPKDTAKILGEFEIPTDKLTVSILDLLTKFEPEKEHAGNFIKDVSLRKVISKETLEKRLAKLAEDQLLTGKSIVSSLKEREDFFKSSKKLSEYNYVKKENIERLLIKNIKSLELSAVKLIQENIRQNFSKDEKLGNLWDNSLTKLLESKQDYLEDIIVNSILKLLDSKKAVMCEKVKSEIYSSLGFFEKMGYSAMGGDLLVAQVFYKFTDEKLPDFLRNKANEILNIMLPFLKRVLEEESMKSLGIPLESEFIIEKLKLFETIEFLDANLISDEIIEDLLNLEDSQIKIFLMQNGIIEYLEEIELVVKGEFVKVQAQKKEVFYGDTLDFIILNMKLGELLGDEGVKEVGLLLQEVWNRVRTEESHILKDVFLNLFEKKTVKEILDVEVVEELIRELKLETLKKNMEEDLSQILEKIFGVVDPKLIVDLGSKLIPGAIDSVEKNIPEILATIDFANISEKQVNAMSVKEIDILFNSFAGAYFGRLKLYGAFGFVFGIHPAVALVALLARMIKNSKK